MTLRYYELSEDVQAGTWYLGDPVDEHGHEVEDPWQFRAGRPVSVTGQLTVPVDQQGRALHFSTAGVGLAPVVHVQVASVFVELAPDDVQFVPVRIKAMPDQYVILVATKRILCIDEPRSQVQFWTAEDGLPEKVGKYYAVDDLHIDVKKVGTTKVFRTEGWNIALIVSEDIKLALERIRATGVRFTPV
ncbi:imm11 family protein [Corallococcus aberystwythensis]|uniref:Immunity MXAN-0049 protein domain-containing protein n=1 Tax=Corallococcus aberystwythensis TaxID=2316722 RepID=A0A3A8Q733_9BACT|nr:DUF1629 domain-containing protein [Corallococcus aberystwythensis]RKH64523.1 hypothetical protein D7W81_18390 [Corallococcus aberystwythensis]